jgi:DNA repair protein RecN (Recombination protein N)
MLTHITLHDFAITEHVDVEFDAGMTVLSGETGAGKSILIDALGLVLGDRAGSGLIRHGCERAEICLGFDISGLPAAGTWLAAHALDAGEECQLRRVISRSGRSRGFINNQPVPLQALRELGEQLVDIHGQHEHQSLLRAPVQCALLDGFASHTGLLERVSELHRDWKAVGSQLQQVISAEADRESRLDLLRYQCRELAALGLGGEQIAATEQAFTRLANAGQLLATCQHGLQCLDNEEGAGAYQLVSETLGELQAMAHLDTRLEDSIRLLGEIQILLQEASEGLQRHAGDLDIDPAELQELEVRIGALHDLARKHRVRPEELPAVHARLQAELDGLEHSDRYRAELQATAERLATEYRAAAGELSESRQRAATRFTRVVTAAMQTLGMPGGQFGIAIQHHPDHAFSARGLDSIEFHVSANPGQPLQPLSRVASGGELSRISLAIQVMCHEQDPVPTLIFDEIDSGIGGGVAEIVGQQLHQLARDRQVFCVTHLPQVAAQADRQLQVSKLTTDDSTRTRIRTLTDDERIDELARMLGGIRITRQTRAHAREMLEQASGKGRPAVKTRGNRG